MWKKCCALTSTRAKHCCVFSPFLLSYPSYRRKHRFDSCCVWGHFKEMMSSHYDATLNMTNTSTGIRDKMMCISCLITTSVTIHTTSLSCPVRTHSIYVGGISFLCGCLSPFKDRYQQSNRTSLCNSKWWCRMCLYFMLGYHHGW